MWITNKELDRMIETRISIREMKYLNDILKKDKEISRLKDEIAMLKLHKAVDNLEHVFKFWNTHWGLDKAVDNGKIEG